MPRYEDLGFSEDELRQKCLIEGDEDKPCVVCGNPTKFIEYCSEVRICSEECMAEWNKKLNKGCN